MKYENDSDTANNLLSILSHYPRTKTIVFDNENKFKSEAVKQILNRQQISVYHTPIAHSVTNGQIERFHSTLLEIIRCIKTKAKPEHIVELAVIEYNKTIHSVTQKRPCDTDINDMEIYSKLKLHQEKMLLSHNKKRKLIDYVPGQKIFVVSHDAARNKSKPRYTEETVKENFKTYIISSKNKKIHKDNIR